MAPRTRKPTPHLVLVVEDDPDLGDTIVTFLKEEGLDAKLARDGDQAMRLVDQLSPSAMILDLMMPRRDGFSVLRELRADGRIANLPVIVVTAIFGLSERLYATELGAADYVTKPFELDELLERVRNVLASRREQPAATDSRPSLISGYAPSWLVHCGQRVAAFGMVIAQYGHSRSGGAGLIRAFAMRNTTNATMMNAITVLMKIP